MGKTTRKLQVTGRYEYYFRQFRKPEENKIDRSCREEHLMNQRTNTVFS
jgi:hypothetical protein